MLVWAKTGDGWALNLDGTDAGAGFSLPRLELHSGSRGWTWVCHLPDGTSRVQQGAADSIATAKRLAVEQARGMLGATYASALDGLAPAQPPSAGPRAPRSEDPG
jgi:hypothetical protein